MVLLLSSAGKVAHSRLVWFASAILPMSHRNQIQVKMSQTEEDHSAALASKQKDIDQLNAQIQSNRQRLDRVEQIENFIVNLYVRGLRCFLLCCWSAVLAGWTGLGMCCVLLLGVMLCLLECGTGRVALGLTYCILAALLLLFYVS